LILALQIPHGLQLLLDHGAPRDFASAEAGRCHQTPHASPVN
jgi:hypothetical protein